MTLTPMAGYRILQSYARDPQKHSPTKAKKPHGNCENAARHFTTRCVQIALEKYALPPRNDRKLSAAARRSLSSLRQYLPRAYHVSIEAFHFTPGPTVPPEPVDQVEAQAASTYPTTPEQEDPYGGTLLSVDSSATTTREPTCTTGFVHGIIRASGVRYSFIAAVRELSPQGPCQLHTFRIF